MLRIKLQEKGKVYRSRIAGMFKVLSDSARSLRRLGTLAFILCLATVALPWGSLFAQATHGINWSWSAVTQDTVGNTITVSGYNLYCSTAAAGPFTSKTNAVPITATTYLETGITLGSTNYCQVTAVSSGGIESAHSATSAGVLFQFPPAAPAAPSGVIQ